MTKYLETKKNSIEEAIKSVVLGESMSGEDVAKRMMKIKTMKSFANKVAKMKTVSRDDLEKMLPDYISGGDITKVIKEKLVGGQKKLDKDKDGDIDGKDFAILRKQKKNEAAKPDFLDLDKDGNKKEPMKVAAKQAKTKKEEVERIAASAR